jgi:ubiquinone/menaquinone biosynthesis C-methylase UbiE
MREHRATESRGVDEADRELPETQRWVDSILARLQPHLPAGRPLQVLDVGAAQGKALIALQRRGCEAVGVEPWPDAIAVAQDLARRHSTHVDIREGSAEHLPFGDEEFDLVVAMSVMEHVRDLPQALREACRVLRPGGIFWFNSASSTSPRQAEIAGFPMFGWYPLPVKRRIMAWAVAHKPGLVGHTETPALNWFTPWSARRKLRRAGFGETWDRWDLYLPDEATGIARSAVLIAKYLRPVRIVGDVLIPGCTYAAQKPRRRALPA